jgi:cbb3-type cytochrome oxidase maturation protein
MDILYLLIPLSVLIVFALMGVFAWALHSRQFDDLDREGERILSAEQQRFDTDQAGEQTPL